MQVFLEHFDQGGKGPPWLQDLRRTAIERFGALGIPSSRQEEWRYTRLDPLMEIPFERAARDLHGGRIENDFVERSAFCKKDDIRLVFVNGYYSAGLSSPGGLPPGAVVGNIASLLRDEPGLMERHLGRLADYRNRPFVALNTAFIQDGFFLYLPRGLVVERPIYLCHLSWSVGGGGGRPIVSHPRNLVVLGEDSRATLVEIYMGGGDQVYFTNAVTEIVAGPASVVDHYRLQQENGNAFHLASLDVRQERQSRVSSFSISLGAGLCRNEVRMSLEAEGVECVLNGLSMVTGRQHVDHQTSIDHAEPHGTSDELYKGILSGQSQGVFNGKIVVRPGARKTVARQTNKNLLLSDEALMNTKPLLEILNDDVRCNHGATIGRLDEAQVFYLRSRGMGESHARSLLTYAFASDLVGRIRIPSLQTALEKWIFRRLLASEMSEEMA